MIHFDGFSLLLIAVSYGVGWFVGKAHERSRLLPQRRWVNDAATIARARSDR